jgi:hypothetical protein
MKRELQTLFFRSAALFLQARMNAIEEDFTTGGINSAWGPLLGEVDNIIEMKMICEEARNSA